MILKWLTAKKSKQKQQNQVSENNLPAVVYLKTKTVFSPRNITEDVWETMDDKARFDASLMMESRILLAGEHYVKHYYEIEDGCVGIVCDHGIYKVTAPITSIDKAIQTTHNLTLLIG